MRGPLLVPSTSIPALSCLTDEHLSAGLKPPGSGPLVEELLNLFIGEAVGWMEGVVPGKVPVGVGSVSVDDCAGEQEGGGTRVVWAKDELVELLAT